MNKLPLNRPEKGDEDDEFARPDLTLWDPILEFTTERAEALCRELHDEIRKLRSAHEKAKRARTVKDMDEFNRLHMRVQSRVVRIMSVQSFFDDEFDRIGLGAVVTRAKEELSYHRILKAEDLIPPSLVSTETEE